MGIIDGIMRNIRKITRISSIIWFTLSYLPLHLTAAAPLVFTIDTAQTQVTISGKVVGTTFSAQGPGSLTTSYQGTINADLTDSTIQFIGGGSISAITNGVWQPAVGGNPGSAPADYGATASVTINIGIPVSATVNAALRNMVLDLTSPPLPLTDGSFDGGSLIFSFITNTVTLDYNYTYGSGSENLNGDSTNAVVSGATVSTNAGVRTLSIQISSQFPFKLLSDNDSLVILNGQLVATNIVNVSLPPPIIQSIVVNGSNIVVTTENTTAQSILLVSTNLSIWTAASSTITTNGLGMIVFTSPVSGPRAFYRMQQ